MTKTRDLADLGGGFIQAGTGAVQRTVESKLQDVVSVLDFIPQSEHAAIKSGTSTYDVTTAIQAAINAAGTGDVALFLPKGVYNCTSQLQILNAWTFSLFGCGVGVSILRFTSPGGITATFSSPSSVDQSKHVATIRDLSIEAACTNAGTALNLSWATAVGDTSIGCIVHNCYIGSKNKEPSENHYWTNGIQINNGRRVYIDKCVFDGVSLTTTMNSAIRLIGGTVEIHIDSCDITHCNTAVQVLDQAEGIFITSTNFVYIDTGVNWQATSPYIGTHLVISGCHFSSITAAIVARRVAHGFVSNCLIQKREGTSANYADIKLLGECSWWKIYDNHFQLRGSGGTEDGVLIGELGGVSYINVHDNTFENRDKAIWIKSTCSDIKCTNNVGSDVSIMIQKDGTSGNRFNLQGNLPLTDSFKTISGATPSVDNSESNYFLTNNGSPTTITNFLHGQGNQRIVVVANDVNTTIQHNASINLQGGANYVMGGGAVIELIYQPVDSIWREIGRRT